MIRLAWLIIRESFLHPNTTTLLVKRNGRWEVEQ